MVLLLMTWMEMRSLLMETGRKDPFYKVIENVAELCSTVLWKVELVSDQLGYLAE